MEIFIRFLEILLILKTSGVHLRCNLLSWFLPWKNDCLLFIRFQFLVIKKAMPHFEIETLVENILGPKVYRIFLTWALDQFQPWKIDCFSFGFSSVVIFCFCFGFDVFFYIRLSNGIRYFWNEKPYLFFTVSCLPWNPICPVPSPSFRFLWCVTIVKVSSYSWYWLY